MPSISGPRSTVVSDSAVTPVVSGAGSSLLMVDHLSVLPGSNVPPRTRPPSFDHWLPGRSSTGSSLVGLSARAPPTPGLRSGGPKRTARHCGYRSGHGGWAECSDVPTSPAPVYRNSPSTTRTYAVRVPAHEGIGQHVYTVHCEWSGTTSGGYESYDRTHSLSTTPMTQDLTLSADPAFRGDPSLLNPEQLVVAAATSCQLLSFLAVAARARVEVLGYVDEGHGIMNEENGPTRLNSIVLRPRIRVADGSDARRVAHLVEVAHRECYVSNSLVTEVRVEPTVIVG